MAVACMQRETIGGQRSPLGREAFCCESVRRGVCGERVAVWSCFGDNKTAQPPEIALSYFGGRGTACRFGGNVQAACGRKERQAVLAGKRSVPFWRDSAAGSVGVSLAACVPGAGQVRRGAGEGRRAARRGGPRAAQGAAPPRRGHLSHADSLA
eukprot:3561841-Pleurochrysis_carterae.AAC.2